MTLFPVPRDRSLPVGEIHESFEADGPPRTHQLALIAAKEALADSVDPPDAIVIGGTTGGMALTETYLKKGDTNRELFKYHSTGSVAEYLALKLKCKGPVITVSTACSGPRPSRLPLRCSGKARPKMSSQGGQIRSAVLHITVSTPCS
ncbi:MAG: hypothetical protein JRF52_02610 [Deltaproteobacteria bacterium]|nr:hypothetical protein [Deltaproteobacteria bacterium]